MCTHLAFAQLGRRALDILEYDDAVKFHQNLSSTPARPERFDGESDVYTSHPGGGA